MLHCLVRYRRRLTINQLIKRMHVGAATCHNDIGVCGTPGVYIGATPNANGHFSKGIDAFGYGLDIELD